MRDLSHCVYGSYPQVSVRVIEQDEKQRFTSICNPRCVSAHTVLDHILCTSRVQCSQLLNDLV